MRAKQSICFRQVEKCGVYSRITADNYTFDTVKEFIYLGSAVTTKNDVSLEIKRKIALPNRCYYGLNRQLSKATSIVLLYIVEAWTLLSTDAKALKVFER